MPQLQSKLQLGTAFREEYLAFYGFLPLELEGGQLRVAFAGTPNADALADLRETFAADLDLIEVPPGELQAAIQLAFGQNESIIELVRGLDAAGEAGETRGDRGVTDIRSLANEPPVVRFVNTLIREAHGARASDIHLEATGNGLRARLRIDGVLADLPSPPRPLEAGIVSRLKLLAELDIADRRAAQDGRIRVRLDDRELDLRVATVPTVHGESVALRLLDRGGRPIGLEELGMTPDMLAEFRRLAGRPHGVILATGPTGSGKTTSLYAALALRSVASEKIITVEDPVEYHLPGVCQVPVRSKAGMTFAAALRGLLRQDPDVLMIGEMRDAETAAIAIQAAMTGHLVFSTLHTNDAVTAVARLVDLGVEPYLIGAAVDGILAQRLVRRNCPNCSESYSRDPSAVALVARRPVGPSTGIRGAGCSSCRNTGYFGRVGIYELFVISDEVKDLIARGADARQLRAAAERQGTKSLVEDGWTKIQAGMTTVEEVLRVVGI
ncbi:MAG: type II/IV secretion system protein [Gemmatimonadetes bacterium]|nr:type II/IV secretion system protein [Gemmatimonadota bacterium]